MSSRVPDTRIEEENPPPHPRPRRLSQSQSPELDSPGSVQRKRSVGAKAGPRRVLDQNRTEQSQEHVNMNMNMNSLLATCYLLLATAVCNSTASTSPARNARAAFGPRCLWSAAWRLLAGNVAQPHRRRRRCGAPRWLIDRCLCLCLPLSPSHGTRPCGWCYRLASHVYMLCCMYGGRVLRFCE